MFNLSTSHPLYRGNHQHAPSFHYPFIFPIESFSSMSPPPHTHTYTRHCRVGVATAARANTCMWLWDSRAPALPALMTRRMEPKAVASLPTWSRGKGSNAGTMLSAMNRGRGLPKVSQKFPNTNVQVVDEYIAVHVEVHVEEHVDDNVAEHVNDHEPAHI